MSESIPSNPRGRNRCIVLAFILGLALAAFVVWWFFLRTVVTTIAATFDGTSDQLQRTVIVPTLDTPMPEGKNEIWCASFQLAWDKLRNNVAKEPIQLDQNQELADRLNNAAVSEVDLPTGASYSAAGFDRDGIQDKIRSDMKRLFPGSPVDLPEPRGVTAYGFLRTCVKFKRPYFEHKNGFRFSGAENVAGFGFSREQEGGFKPVREQVGVLYVTFQDELRENELTTCAVDLCVDSQPNQIVLARLPRGATLGETLTAHEKLATAPTATMERRRFTPTDHLRVPNMNWRIAHQFRELLDCNLLNQSVHGLPITAAAQVIEFSLDRSGAELRSESLLKVAASPRDFYFDRPFLLFVKKRDANRLFFVMWVDNDELLQHK
jgi:hypothetical protein